MDHCKHCELWMVRENGCKVIKIPLFYTACNRLQNSLGSLIGQINSFSGPAFTTMFSFFFIYFHPEDYFLVFCCEKQCLINLVCCNNLIEYKLWNTHLYTSELYQDDNLLRALTECKKTINKSLVSPASATTTALVP